MRKKKMFNKKEYNKNWNKNHPNYEKERYKKDRKKRICASTKYYIANKDKISWRLKNYYKQRCFSPKYLYQKYKYQSAKNRNLDFELSYERFGILISSPCEYCGEIISPFNGVDRVDSTIGYIENNCVSCCKYCNMMKRNLTKEKFIEQINKINNWCS
jgi:hypothetical protein